MLEPLIDFLLNTWKSIVPFFIIDEFEEAVILRLGKYNRSVKRGLHWRWWFVEDYMKETVVTTTMDISEQSLITSDDKKVVIASVVKYHINDIRKFLLDITDVFDAIEDSIKSIMAHLVMTNTYKDLKELDLSGEAEEALQEIVKKWGITVEAVTITDFTESPTLRLIGVNINQMLNEE